MFTVDSNRVFPISLKADKDVPEATRPALLVKALTCREHLPYSEAIAAAAAAEKGNDLPAAIAKLVEAVGVGFRAARNLPQLLPLAPKDGETQRAAVYPADLPEVLSFDGLWEVALRCRSASAVEEPEKKA